VDSEFGVSPSKQFGVAQRENRNWNARADLLPEPLLRGGGSRGP
jgi:hypothetical protein